MKDCIRDICQAIADKKGFNIVALDVREVCSMTDFFIIAEGSVDRHVVSIARHVEQELSKYGLRPINVEGMQDGEWVVLDYLDCIIHLFIPEFRQYYRLEEVWKEGKVMNIPVDYAVESRYNSPI